MYIYSTSHCTHTIQLEAADSQDSTHYRLPRHYYTQGITCVHLYIHGTTRTPPSPL